MNDEQLADILASHLDALLDERSPTPPPGDEVAQLLHLAQDLVETAPAPRPEFGLALKSSLLASTSGSGGPNGSGGPTIGPQLLLVVIVGGLVILSILALIGGAAVFRANQLAIFGDPSPAGVPSQVGPGIDQEEPASSGPYAPTLETVPAPTAEPGSTNEATESVPSDLLKPTIVLDKLPPITDTIEATETFSSPPDLVPGSGQGQDGGDSGDGGGAGDRNKGHGNDADGHDEDNPGRSGDDDD
jgi:hypothetical protein